MVATPNRGVGMRWLGAVVLVAAAVLAGVWAWWPAGVEQVEDDLYDPSTLRAFVRESVQVASDSDRFAVFHFVKLDGIWTPDDDWFDELVASPGGREFFSRQAYVRSVFLREPLMRYHLPEPLQCLASVEGGAAVTAIEAAGDAYVGDKNAARLRHMAELVLCGGDGRMIAFWHHIVGMRGPPVDLLGDLSAKIVVGEQLDASLTRAKTLSGVERAKALAAGLELLDEWVCQMNYAAELQQIVDTEGEEIAALRSWCRRLLRERALEDKTTLVTNVVGSMIFGFGNDVPGRIDDGELTPTRIRSLFKPLREEYGEDVEIMQVMALYQASVDLNYLVNKDQVERIIADLSVARDLQGESLVQPKIEQAIKDLKSY